MKRFLLLILPMLLLSQPGGGGFEDEFGRLFKVKGDSVQAKRVNVVFGGGSFKLTFVGSISGEADSAIYAATVYGQVGWAGHCIDAYLDSVYGCSPVVFTVPVKIDSTLTADSLYAGKLVVDKATIDSTIINDYLAMGDTSSFGKGIIITPNYIDIFHDTLRFFKGSLMPFPHWVNLCAKIYTDDYSSELYIESNFGGNGEIIFRSDECKVDTHDLIIFANSFFPGADTGATMGNCELGTPVYRFKNANVRHFTSTDPGKGDSLHIHMEADTAYYDSENPNKFDNDMFVDGDLTSSGVTTLNDSLKFGKTFIKSKYIDVTIPTHPLTNPPDESDEDNFYTLDFDASTDQQVYMQMDTPKGYKDAGTIIVHYGFFIDGAVGGDQDTVVWGCEYKKLVHGSDVFDFDAGTAIVLDSVEITATTDEKVLVQATATLVTTGWVENEHMLLRFFRDADNGEDTHAADGRMVLIHVDYEMDQPGGY